MQNKENIIELKDAPCKKCGGVEAKVFETRHSNGTIHRRANCAYCESFIKFLPLEKSEQFVMPFGKHKNVRLANIPTDYLVWALSTPQREISFNQKSSPFSSGMLKHFRNELERRGKIKPPTVIGQVISDEKALS